MTFYEPSPPEPRDVALSDWWYGLDQVTRQRVRDADYFDGADLPTDIATSLRNAKVQPAASAYFVNTPRDPEGVRLSAADVDTLRALDGVAPDPWE